MASKHYVLTIGGKQVKNQSKEQASAYIELLRFHDKLTTVLNNSSVYYDNLATNLEQNLAIINNENIKLSPAMTTTIGGFEDFLLSDGAENYVVAEEDGQFYEVSPPKNGKKKKKKKV